MIESGPNRPSLAARPRGVLAWFIHNPVAANLLMLLILIGGFLSMVGMRQELFPEFDARTVSIQVPYPGAAPREVEQGVCKPIEEAIAAIEGIERIRAFAFEASGTVMAELEEYADSRKVLNEIESAVDRIQTFPEQIEDPVISQSSRSDPVIGLFIYGNVSQATLKELSERVRDELTADDGISQIDISGLRRPEIHVEVSEQRLRRFGLTFDQVAGAVRAASRDLPGGTLRTTSGEVLLRTTGQLYSGAEFERVVVYTRPDGTVLRLGQVANVIDGFEETEAASFFNGMPAATLNIKRVGDQDTLAIAAAVKQYVKDAAGRMPEGIKLAYAFDQSTWLQGRIDLLVRNACLGLILVFFCLTLFLDLRLAFWTTLGIPISFMGAFWVMPALDMTVNMISLFAFIVVLGIVVDDAIVIGENIFSWRQRGLDPVRASLVGVREMAAPVVFAILTSVVAFLPLLFTAGQMGKIMRFIPFVVITVLLLSLIEALLILPAHLSFKAKSGKPGPIARVQAKVRAGLDWWVNGPYLSTLKIAVKWRYATLGLCIAVLLITVGFVAGGHVKFKFFEDMGADNVVVALKMPQGTPVEQTRAVLGRIEAAAERVRDRIDARLPGENSIFRHVITSVGSQPFVNSAGGPGASQSITGGAVGHLGEVNIELLKAEQRGELSSEQIASMWRDEVGVVPGVSSLSFVSSYFTTGEAVNVEVAHTDFAVLLKAVESLKSELSQYSGVVDIDDTFEPGKVELQVEGLTEAGYALGLRVEDVGRQLRSGFYGEEAQRIQRGRDDVRVMVRYPADQRTSLEDLQNTRLRLRDGIEVPLPTVAEVKIGRGYAQIDRVDRRRVVNVTADVDASEGNANEINRSLVSNVLPKLEADFPGLSWRFAGEQKEQQESLQSLGVNFAVAMLAIFGLLGVQFRSYLQPLIVMSAIPFGLVGAVVGHVLLGFNLSFLSGFGVVALTGVVVNDSLIMIDVINRLREEGKSIDEIVIASGVRRFRPILLTTLTTFCGLTPMLVEQSLQARFLVPMAVSLAFGVAFATAITLIIVPVLYVILEDLRALFLGPDPADEASLTAAPTH